jgi:hypothetical protein
MVQVFIVILCHSNNCQLTSHIEWRFLRVIIYKRPLKIVKKNHMFISSVLTIVEFSLPFTFFSSSIVSLKVLHNVSLWDTRSRPFATVKEKKGYLLSKFRQLESAAILRNLNESIRDTHMQKASGGMSEVLVSQVFKVFLWRDGL